ncbi:MAG: Ig-like domain-containing protein [bacterium]|nr:Ig-like domain-containing protein [bacterium]
MSINQEEKKDKNKLNTVILIALLAFVVGILIVVKTFISGGTSKDSIPTPTPLSLIKSQPPSGGEQTTSFINAITFTFSTSISPKTVYYEIDPSIESTWNIDASGKNLTIRPLNPWEPNQAYKITISKNLTSTEGSKLRDNVVYIYKLNLLPGE